jgi:predicted AAA+ superfamily ATPase
LSFLAETDRASSAWRQGFITTFLQRDLPQFGVSVPWTTLLRFWTMVAHCHGQVWNAAEPARSLGISETSVRRYLDLLTDLFLIRQLLPWHANVGKRQVKAPKVYFRDTGLLHQLLGLRSEKELLTHPKCGASWEGYVVEETIKALEPDEVYYWATHGGAEIDLVVRKDGRMLGVECKRADAPTVTPSMRHALTDLRLERIAVIYPGARRYAMTERIEAVPVEALVDGMAGVFPPRRRS